MAGEDDVDAGWSAWLLSLVRKRPMIYGVSFLIALAFDAWFWGKEIMVDVGKLSIPAISTFATVLVISEAIIGINVCRRIEAATFSEHAILLWFYSGRTRHHRLQPNASLRALMTDDVIRRTGEPDDQGFADIRIAEIGYLYLLFRGKRLLERFHGK